LSLKIEKFSGEGHSPSADPQWAVRRGTPPPHTYPLGASILAPTALIPQSPTEIAATA